MDEIGFELLEGLSECISLCRRLDEKLDCDVEEIASCLRGDVYNEYERAARAVQDGVRDMKKRLMQLQSELSLGQ